MAVCSKCNVRMKVLRRDRACDGYGNDTTIVHLKCPLCNNITYIEFEQEPEVDYE